MLEAALGKQNCIVVRFKNGKLLKGFTRDFAPGKGNFHLTSESAQDEGKIHEVKISELKAVFFVKTLAGDKTHEEKKRFEEAQKNSLRGLKIKVEFYDGEIIRGVSLGYNKEKPGFFIIPVDSEGNNERIYIVADSCRSVKLGSAAQN